MALQVSFLSIRFLQIIAHRSKQISPLSLYIRQPLPPPTEKVAFLLQMDSLLEKQCTCIRSTGKAFVAPPPQHPRSIHFAPPFMDCSRPPGASPIQNSSVSYSTIGTPPRSGAALTTTSSTKCSHARERSILPVRYKTTTGIVLQHQGCSVGSQGRLQH